MLHTKSQAINKADYVAGMNFLLDKACLLLQLNSHKMEKSFEKLTKSNLMAMIKKTGCQWYPILALTST